MRNKEILNFGGKYENIEKYNLNPLSRGEGHLRNKKILNLVKNMKTLREIICALFFQGGRDP